MNSRFFSATSLSMVAIAVASVSHLPNARADRFEGNPVTKTLLRQGKNLSGADVYEFDLSAEVDRVTEQVTWTNEPVTDIECSQQPGDGKGDWHGFFNAREEDKAAALDAAVLGIGPKTAKLIVRDKLLSSKPRTWQAFSGVIEEAQRRYGGNISYQVLVQYGSQNARNLGYMSQDTCREVTRYQLVPRTVEFKTPAMVMTRHFRLEIQGGALLPSESESISVTFDGLEDSVQVSSYFNQYQTLRLNSSSDSSVFRLVGARLAATPGNTVSAVASISSDGELVLSASDLLMDASDRDAQLARGTTTLKISVYQVRKLWFDKVIFETELSLPSMGQNVVRTGFRPNRADEIYVSYRVKRVGSPYFSQGASEAKKTNHVR